MGEGHLERDVELAERSLDDAVEALMKDVGDDEADEQG